MKIFLVFGLMLLPMTAFSAISEIEISVLRVKEIFKKVFVRLFLSSDQP